jgi:hypothetical protein
LDRLGVGGKSGKSGGCETKRQDGFEKTKGSENSFQVNLKFWEWKRAVKKERTVYVGFTAQAKVQNDQARNRYAFMVLSS